MNEEFNVSIENLINNQLSFEGYFILWCLNSKNEPILLEYIRNCRKIPTEIFNILRDRDLIFINYELVPDNKISFKALRLTDKGKELFTINDIDSLFEEFRNCYPKSTKQGRKLHSDLKRCKTLYKKIIGNDLQQHKLLCKCVKLYQQEKIRSNSEEFIQNLPTWLHQENYKQYVEEARRDDLVLLEDKGHSEDI